MPIIVDPSQGRAAAPTEAVSQDGRLTATVDPAHAGVLLKYDGLDLNPTRVQFTRSGVPVRSGWPAYAPGGVALAYDHEVGLGQAASYTATPLTDGAPVGEASSLSLLSAAAKGRAGQPGIWLKSTSDPASSLEALATDSSELGYDVRSASTAVLGSSYPVVTAQPNIAPKFPMTIWSEDAEELGKIARLLSLPGYVTDGTPPAVLMVQYMPEYQRLDQYVMATSVKVGPPSVNPRDPQRVFAVEFTSVKRPDPTDAPLRIPGRSYEDVGRIYTAYSDIPQSNASYVQLATG